MGPGRTPTVHRCPKGKAVGGPQQTTSDERPSDNDMPRTNVLSGKQVQTDVLSAKKGVDRHLCAYTFSGDTCALFSVERVVTDTSDNRDKEAHSSDRYCCAR